MKFPIRIMKLTAPILFSLAVFFLGCAHDSTVERTLKYADSDEFIETIVESQYFNIQLDEGQVVEGKNGTRIVFPKGCLTDEKGKTVNSDITVELAEAFRLSDMILSNLTTTSGETFLETDGMIYLNLTSKGKQLLIDPDNPLYIEIPTKKRNPEMEIYQGVRDIRGNIDWIDPQPIQNYLIPIDIELLDFLPSGFKTEVANGLPFRSHQTATQELIDSLYYSLSVSDGIELTKGYVATEINEEYATGSSQADTVQDLATEDLVREDCGVDPAYIKVIKNDRFQNSYIATREFEARLQVIFEACKNEVFEVYINNLGNDLWFSDSVAAQLVSDDNIRLKFEEYASERLTNVEDGEKYAEILKAHFVSELNRVKADLNVLINEMKETLAKKNLIAEKVAEEYKALLAERERFRMESYGFQQSRTGWINIDVGIVPKDWGPHKLELIASEGDSFDRIHTYLIFRSMKSLFRLQSEDKNHFYVGNLQTRELLMPKNSEASCITIAYKDGKPFIGIEDFVTGSTELINTKPRMTTETELDELLSQYESFSRENSIQRDLEFMVQMDAEKRRQQKLVNESEFVSGLHAFVFSCCNEDGAMLFEANCGACHTTSPYTYDDFRALGGIGSVYEESWFVNWTQDAYAMYKSGDPVARRIIDKYDPIYGVHMPLELSEEEVKAIYRFLGVMEDA